MIYCAGGIIVGCLLMVAKRGRAMETLGNLFVVGIPAVCGLIGWAALRQRNIQPLLAGCVALAVALAVMTVIFLGMYTIQ
jgi:hypothetical protein